MAISYSLAVVAFSPIAIAELVPVKAPFPVAILLIPFAIAPSPQAIELYPGALPRFIGFPVVVPLFLTVHIYPPYSFLSSVVIVPAAIAAARKHNLFLNFPFCVFLSSFFFLLSTHYISLFSIIFRLLYIVSNKLQKYKQFLKLFFAQNF